jgi:PiT family inorganic phosphate transporter
MISIILQLGSLGIGTVALLLVTSLASLFTAWTIGAGSSGSTPFSPAVSANAISTMRAAFVVGMLGFAGAVLQGASVTHTIGGELIRGVTLTPIAVTVILITAAGLIAIGVFAGYPIATAFTVTGAVVGAGLALGGEPAWNEYGMIVTMWILTPVVGVIAGYVTARLLRGERVSEHVLVPVLGGIVGLIIANMGFGLLGPPGEAASIAAAVAARSPGPPVGWRIGISLGFGLVLAAVLARAMARNANTAQRHFLLALGGLVAFSAGGAKVGLAVGPLLPLFESLSLAVPLIVVLIGGGIGLLLGSWTAAPRMIKALTQDYSSLGPRRSIAVLVPAFGIAQIAIFYGIPMSFNEIFVSAIIGSGYAAGAETVDMKKSNYTVLAWIGSLILALVLSYGAQTVLMMIF